MKGRRFLPVLALLLLACLATPALAQTKQAGPDLGWNGWGIRFGLTSDPDQVYGGVHFELGEFARNVRFRPTIEIGAGDDVTLVQALAEVHYVFSKVQVWHPYVGGGAGFNYVKVDLPPSAPAGADDDDTDVSIMGVGGVETKLKSGVGFFFEGKVGLSDDDPDFKVGVGWTWK
jgi:opacity protein-like surface antigen